MNAFWGGVLQAIMGMLVPVIQQVTPAITAELNGFATQLYLKALATPNPWDDFFLGMLLDILKIPRPPPPS